MGNRSVLLDGGIYTVSLEMSKEEINKVMEKPRRNPTTKKIDYWIYIHYESMETYFDRHESQEAFNQSENNKGRHKNDMILVVKIND